MKVDLHKPLRELHSQQLGLAVICLLIGLVAGHLLWNRAPHDPRYRLATSKQVQQAKEAITKQFEKQTAGCQEQFQLYLRVNRYANRAVMRDCANNDTFLAKDIKGRWYQTTINVSLDLRANPIWRDECLAQDILRADDVIRPENGSIDIHNLVQCRQLRESELVLPLLQRTFGKDESVRQADIDSYIKSAESF